MFGLTDNKQADLLGIIQSDFPVTKTPFCAISERLGWTEQEVISSLRLMMKNKIILILGAGQIGEACALRVLEENINLWASCGWVDVRMSGIKYWQSVLTKVYEEITLLKNSESVVLDRNWQKAEEGDIGELLGLIYSILGGERKTKFN